ncbi:MAG: hypothetical protein OEM38_12145 [Gammaproteobacteria bacterium]|nr:hypothetical protein [Gammaproteobacteria bacterium]
MTKAQYKPVLIYMLLFIAGLSLLLSFIALTYQQYPISAIAVLSSIYILTKYLSIKKQNLELLETSFNYCGKSINFFEIESIKILEQDNSVTPNLKLNPLANSTIYNIQLKNEKIQIIGKLYKNADKFIGELAKKAKISIQPMKK